MQNRSYNPFHARALQAAAKNQVRLDGKPHSESKEIMAISGACVGYAVVPVGGTDDEFLKRSYDKQLEFERALKEQGLSGSFREQVSLMAKMSGSHSSSDVSYTSIDKVEQEVSAISQEFRKPVNVFGMLTSPGHATSIEVVGNGQCRMRDADAGRAEGECRAVFGFFRDLNKMGRHGTGKESYVFTTSSQLSGKY